LSRGILSQVSEPPVSRKPAEKWQRRRHRVMGDLERE
jgi:hypothetical protein